MKAIGCYDSMDAIVIGSGIAGLATSIRLARKGYNVDVYEVNKYPGGKLSSIQLGEYRFDAGPSLFTMPQYVDELIQLSEQEISFSYSKKKVVCRYFFNDDVRFTAYANKDRFIREAEKVLKANPKALDRYFKSAKEKYDLTAPLFLEKSLHKASSYFSRQTLQAISNMGRLHLNHDLNAINEKLLGQNEKLLQLFNRYATYNGSSPYKTPGIMSMIPHLEQHFGTFFPHGGMISITQALEKTAKSLGVNFHFEKKVQEIIVKENKAIGIRISDEKKLADLIISNMDIVPTYRELMPNEKAPEKTLRQERSSSALIFYWGVKASFPELDLHNIFFSSDYKKEFDQIFDDKALPEEPTIYVNITSKEEPQDAPEGCENWFVMVNVASNQGQDWEIGRKRVRKAIIDRLSKTLNKNIEELIEVEDYLDPIRIESRTSSFRGALYGAASNNKFAAFLRHPNFSQKIKNLFFCGGSVHPGGGIPLCLLSAKIVSDLIPNAA